MKSRILSKQQVKKVMNKQKKYVVSMTSLGNNGGFGNQVLQYIFLKAYSRIYGMELQVPDWAGTYYFGLKDKQVQNQLPVLFQKEFKEIFDLYWKHQYEHRNVSIGNSSFSNDIFLHQSPPFQNIDFWGYFALDFHTYLPIKEYLQSELQPSHFVKTFMEERLSKITAGRTLISIHLRRGDYLNYKGTDMEKTFYITPTNSYKKLLNNLWDTLDRPILYIASDDLESVLPEFQEYQPISYKDIGQSVPTSFKDFFVDYYVLCHSDIMAISNSTFSFTASALNNKGHKFYRPLQDKEILIEYKPWESWPLY
jgi:hypothetical protein